ncbi:MAG: protein kinase, partial [bacterium]
ALRRKVAVKEPREDNDSSANHRILDEALIMGQIEHPNVVPAYELGKRNNGRPILVMKRVEGTSWEDVLRGRSEAPGGGEADLVWHLRVLLQVCNALRFAHAKRVVHRDLKPDNVMIGDFGEVYLLDWGVALSLDPDAEEGIPTIFSTSGLAGTPVFMAPEMAVGDPTQIDARTDVYLLGANLHFVLTGSAPHHSDTLLGACQLAYESAPKVYGPEVPQELAMIANKAMAREKSDRYPTVAAFAKALADYLEHRASYALSDAARATLEDSATLEDDENGRLRVLEAEFGFQHALAIWAENPDAKRGLQQALERRIQSCINREEVGSAKAALAQLPSPNDALARAIAELEQRLAEQAERMGYLERLEKDLDLRSGTRSRQRAVIIMGLGFVGLCVWHAWATRPGQPPTPIADLVTSFWRIAVIAGIGVAFFWRKLMANVANRRLVGYFVSCLAAIFLLRLAAQSLDPPGLYIQMAEIVVYGLCSFAIGLSSSRALAFIGALGYSAAVLVTAYTGQMWVAMASLAVVHAVYFGAMAWLWRPSRTRTRR